MLAPLPPHTKKHTRKNKQNDTVAAVNATLTELAGNIAEDLCVIPASDVRIWKVATDNTTGNTLVYAICDLPGEKLGPVYAECQGWLEVRREGAFFVWPRRRRRGGVRACDGSNSRARAKATKMHTDTLSAHPPHTHAHTQKTPPQLLQRHDVKDPAEDSTSWWAGGEVQITDVDCEYVQDSNLMAFGDDHLKAGAAKVAGAPPAPATATDVMARVAIVSCFFLTRLGFALTTLFGPAPPT